MQPFLTNASLMSCPHGGGLALRENGARVLSSGAAILTVDAVASIESCPVPLPATCVTARWSAGSRVFIGGRPALLAGNPGVCRSASDAPQGPVGIVSDSARVFGVG